APGAAVTGSSVALSAAGVATGIAEAVPAGWRLTGARCEDRNAALTGNPPGPAIGSVTDGTTLLVPAQNVKAGADLLCTFTNTFIGLSLSGQVILDNGAGGGTAHDGAANGAEEGLAGILMRLTDCGSLDYARARTDAAG